MKKIISMLLVLTLCFSVGIKSTRTVKARTTITGFGTQNTGTLQLPNCGDAITFPNLVKVVSTTPEGHESEVDVAYHWCNLDTKKTYGSNWGEDYTDEVFIPGNWELIVWFGLNSDYNVYNLPQSYTFNRVIGGKEMTLADYQGACIGYKYQFVIEDTGIAPKISTTKLLNADKNRDYEDQIDLSYGTKPVKFSVVSGSLPNGLQLGEDGIIEGKPTLAGNYSFTVRAKNSYGYDDKKIYLEVLSDEDKIYNFTLDSSKEIIAPKVGDKISFPEGISIKSVDPVEARSNLRLFYRWANSDNTKSYTSDRPEDGVFTEGDWILYIYVAAENINYLFDYESFKQVESLKKISLGGTTFEATVLDQFVIGYTKTFSVKKEKITKKTPETTTKKRTVPPGKIKKVKPAKKSILLSWKKIKGVSGYHIQYSLKKNFKKKCKSMFVKSAKKTKAKIKKLKAKKTYFVRIRTYKIINKKKYYSAWSKVVKRKTK